MGGQAKNMPSTKNMNKTQTLEKAQALANKTRVNWFVYPLITPNEWMTTDKKEILSERSEALCEEITPQALMDLTLHQLTEVINCCWVKVNFGALPYLRAMEQMETVETPFYRDSGHSIVLYFLSNASSWRGTVAEEVKAELIRRVGRK